MQAENSNPSNLKSNNPATAGFKDAGPSLCLLLLELLIRKFIVQYRQLTL